MSRFTFLSFLFLSLFTSRIQAQKNKDKIQYVRSYDYKITIDIGYSFGSAGSTYILDNKGMDFYDSLDNKNGKLKPLTLYYISPSEIIGSVDSNNKKLIQSDTTAIRFSKESSEMLFDLTKSFFKKIDLSNIDTLINGTKTELDISDDASASIELEFRGRHLYASISSISNPFISTKEFRDILIFIQKFKPQKNK